MLHVAADLLSVLSMAVSYREKVAVLQSAEVRHCDPAVLVHLVGVARRQTRLRREGELRDRVRVHLLRVAAVVREWSRVSWVHWLRAWLSRSLNWLLRRLGLRVLRSHAWLLSQLVRLRASVLLAALSLCSLVVLWLLGLAAHDHLVQVGLGSLRSLADSIICTNPNRFSMKILLKIVVV